MVAIRGSVAPVLVALLVLLAGCGMLGGDASTPAETVATAASEAPTDSPAANGTTATATAATPSPTATATATPATPTATVPPTETVFSETGIRVVEVHADAEGRDAENLNDEYIVLKNTGDHPIDLSGWRVKDQDGHVHEFSEGLQLEIGETITLHSGSGSQTPTDRYWWADEPVWDDGGETIFVFDERGQKVYQRTYG